jgi:uncharacterized protein YjbK
MPKRPLEKELKYALSAKAYARLIATMAGSRSKTVSQHNVYFDDARKSLRRKRFGLRVRLIDGKTAKMALKFPAGPQASRTAGYKVRHEIESAVSARVARALVAGRAQIATVNTAPVRYLRTVFSPQVLRDLIPFADLRTERTMVPFRSGLKLEIDRCVAFGKVFYELEIETETPVTTDRAIRKQLEKLEIRCRPLRRSKLARVFSLLRQQPKGKFIPS